MAADRKGDYAEAVGLLRLLAEQGGAAAQYELGWMHANGHGVAQDYTQAVAWYRDAAENGHAAAQASLGAMYFMGWGVPRDCWQAAVWYGKAAEQGYAKAQTDLGLMYFYGRGAPQDYALAHMLLSLAASHAEDAETRELAIKNRDLVAAMMTPAQIAEAQRLARDWKPSK